MQRWCSYPKLTNVNQIGSLSESDRLPFWSTFVFWANCTFMFYVAASVFFVVLKKKKKRCITNT